MLAFPKLLELENQEIWPVSLGDVKTWLEDFICRPHPKLIAAGDHAPICPCAESSFEANRICVAHVNLLDVAIENRKIALVHQLREIGISFGNETATKSDNLDCLIVTVGGLKTEEYAQVVESSHRDIKIWVLEKGLMLGAFHPLNTKQDSRNLGVLVMRSPVPLFVYRRMVRRDGTFLSKDVRYQSIYSYYFGKQ